MAELLSNLGQDVRSEMGDIDPTFPLDTPERTLAYAIMRSLTHEAGRLWWAPDVGYDLNGLLGRDVDEEVIERQVNTQCLSDERVESAEVTVNVSADKRIVTVSVTLTPVGSEAEVTFSIQIGDVAGIISASVL